MQFVTIPDFLGRHPGVVAGQRFIYRQEQLQPPRPALDVAHQVIADLLDAQVFVLDSFRFGEQFGRVGGNRNGTCSAVFHSRGLTAFQLVE